VLIVTGFELAIGETWDGETYAFLLPTVPDQAPEAVREGLARRRITAVTGRCPCGGRLTLPNRKERRRATRSRRPVHLRVEHENDCPAIDDTLTAALRGWKR
jgi:hypothetical protein